MLQSADSRQPQAAPILTQITPPPAAPTPGLGGPAGRAPWRASALPI